MLKCLRFAPICLVQASIRYGSTVPAAPILPMTENSLFAYAAPPVIAPQPGASIWAPGRWLLRHLSVRRKLLVLLLSAWLPLLLLLLLLLWNGSTPQPDVARLDPHRGLMDGRFGAGAMPRWALWGLLAAAWLAPLYLAVCISRSLVEGLDRLRRGAQDMALGRAGLHMQGFGTDELGQALDALGAAGQSMARLIDTAGQHAESVTRSSHELADAHRAMQLQALELRAAIGEIARRTVALCGMLDSDMQDAERASADLDAIHDDEVQSLQLMAALRSRLLALAHHCQALGAAARGTAAGARPEAAGESISELGATAAVEIAHCHQLSERFGGAERLNGRRIESMRTSADRLLCRAERGVREGQQLMALTRQVEALMGSTLQRLEQMAASCASLRSLVEPSVLARAASPGPAEPTVV